MRTSQTPETANAGRRPADAPCQDERNCLLVCGIIGREPLNPQQRQFSTTKTKTEKPTRKKKRKTGTRKKMQKRRKGTAIKERKTRGDGIGDRGSTTSATEAFSVKAHQKKEPGLVSSATVRHHVAACGAVWRHEWVATIAGPHASTTTD